MVPRPIEGPHAAVMQASQVASSPPGGATISLGKLIDFILQRTYHELTVLAELLPRKTDLERKIEIVQFASRTRQLFVRLLALVKWAASASKVEKCAAIMAFLDKQSMFFVEMADVLAVMARETLVHARLPSFHLPCAVEVLTLGSYSRLPTCIKDKIVPPDPITPAERKSTLARLDQIIQYRLVSSELPPQMRSLRIDNGRVTFHVEHEFEVSVTLMGDGPLIPWRLLDIDILVEDKETGDGKALVHSLQVQYIHQLIQSRLIDNPRPLHDLYNTLHSFCLSLQLEVLHSQVLQLCRERLGDFIHVEDYMAGNHLVVSYWRDHVTTDNQGYRLCVQLDPFDPSKPLKVSHIPQLSSKDAIQADQAIKSDHLSIEKLLIHTVHIRTKHKLAELRDIIQTKLGVLECPISGSPAVMHVPLLVPCMQSEELLITVDTHTGYFLAHVPQFEPPMMDEIQECLNKDQGKLEGPIMELRFWITLQRCEKTIQHLPALTSEKLPLIVPSDHPLEKFGKHKLFIKLCKHQYYYVVVHLSEKPNNPCEIEQTYSLMTIQPQQLEEDILDQKEETILDTELPKSYLKVVNFLQLDTFAITHGPCTKIDVSDHSVGGKRKLLTHSDSPAKRMKHTGYFIAELAHVVAMCDERIPFATLTQELNKKGICHQGIQVEANGTNYVVKIVQMPCHDGCDSETSAALRSALLSCTIRLQGKGTRAWLVEFVFCNCPLVSQSVKEQGPRRPVYFMYDFAAGTSCQVAQMVVDMLQDWITMGHLYGVVLQFAEILKYDQHFYSSIMDIKSFTYKKLVLGYGPNKSSTVTIYWRPSEKRFHLAFVVVGQTASASNPHTIVAAQLQHEFNQHHSVAALIQDLHDTYAPLLSMSKLPSSPQLGVINSRPQVPIQTFIIIPQSATHIRIVYRTMYCLDIQCRPEGLVAIRDGAYSVFDKGKAVEDFATIQGLKAFLSKFVDETTGPGRGRSQSEDDNPLSPVPTLEALDPFLAAANQLKPGSPAQRCGQEGAGSSGGATAGSTGGLRFHLPMTPPSGSNPHTPASPHTSMLSQSYGASPNPSFPLASPPSLGSQSQSHVSPSPSMLHMQAQSPGNIFAASSPVNPLHVPSPSFLPAPSPSSSTSQVTMQSPASFMGQQSQAEGGSPFPAPSGSTGNLSMSSPAPGTWPGSPSLSRPSPRGPGTAQSPGSSSHPALHSPQAVVPGDHNKPPGVPPSSSVSRVLPQRAWAAASPTLLTHKAFDVLCSPSPMPISQPGGTTASQGPFHYSSLERFLGCVFMRRNLQRVIQNDESLIHMTAEPGVIQFKVETVQCRVTLNTTTLQSLHLKLSPNQDFKDQWGAEELQILERFFDTKVVSAPYKPNAFLAFGRILNAPLRILKDCIHIMQLELYPERTLKWAVHWCLTFPPAAPPFAPPGMSAVVMIKNKMLFVLQLTRIGLNLPAGVEPQTVVVPIVYDHNANTTLLADRKDTATMSPTDPFFIIGNTLKRFADYHPQLAECSIYPAIRELLTNLVIPI